MNQNYNSDFKPNNKKYWLWGEMIFLFGYIIIGGILFISSPVSRTGLPFIQYWILMYPFGIIFQNFISWIFSYFMVFPSEFNIITLGIFNSIGWIITGIVFGSVYGRMKYKSPAKRAIGYLITILIILSFSAGFWIISSRLPYSSNVGYDKSQLKESDNPSKCESLKENADKAKCYYQLALLKNDENLCLSIPTVPGYFANQFKCYSKIAFRKKDENICRMKYTENVAQYNIDSCIAYVALAKDDANLCKNLTDWVTAECYNNFSALKKADYCKNIPSWNTPGRKDCYCHLAAFTKDTKWCSFINNCDCMQWGYDDSVIRNRMNELNQN